jgi:ferredoxin
MTKKRLAVNPIACTGHGICAEMLPELIGVDEWGYPILADRAVPGELAALAKRAVRLCPALALRLEATTAERKAPSNPRPPTANHRGGSDAVGSAGRAGTR